MNYGTFVIVKQPAHSGIEGKLAGRDIKLWLELAVAVVIEPFQFVGMLGELEMQWDSWHVGGELYGKSLHGGFVQDVEKVSNADYAKFHRVITPDNIYGADLRGEHAGMKQTPHLRFLQEKYPSHLAVAVLTHS